MSSPLSTPPPTTPPSSTPASFHTAVEPALRTPIRSPLEAARALKLTPHRIALPIPFELCQHVHIFFEESLCSSSPWLTPSLLAGTAANTTQTAMPYNFSNNFSYLADPPPSVTSALRLSYPHPHT